MDLDLDELLGADDSYQVACSRTRRILWDLADALADQPEVWRLVLAPEAVLQQQVVIALDAGFRSGSLEPR